MRKTATELLDTLEYNQKISVEAIAMDMWPAFMNAAKAMIPNADIVHDKFHISGYLGKAVDAVKGGRILSSLKRGTIRSRARSISGSPTQTTGARRTKAHSDAW